MNYAQMKWYVISFILGLFLVHFSFAEEKHEKHDRLNVTEEARGKRNTFANAIRNSTLSVYSKHKEHSQANLYAEIAELNPQNVTQITRGIIPYGGRYVGVAVYFWAPHLSTWR